MHATSAPASSVPTRALCLLGRLVLERRLEPDFTRGRMDFFLLGHICQRRVSLEQVLWEQGCQYLYLSPSLNRPSGTEGLSDVPLPAAGGLTPYILEARMKSLVSTIIFCVNSALGEVVIISRMPDSTVRFRLGRGFLDYSAFVRQC